MKKVFLFLFTFIVITFNIANLAYSYSLDEEYKLQNKWEKLLEKYIDKNNIKDYDETSEEYQEIIKKWIRSLKNQLLKEWEKLLKKQWEDINNIISDASFDPLNNNEDFILYSYYKLANSDKNNESLMKISAYSTTSTYYNRTEAVNYAQKWAKWRNPDYYDFWTNYDCTNFVSQTLQAWYMPFIVDWLFGKYDDDNWYYNYYTPTNSSWTWWWADNFYDHVLQRTDRYSVKSSYTYLWEWDLIFVDWTNNGSVDLGMIITDKTGSSPSQIKLSYHSNNRLDKPLQEVFNDPSAVNAKYYYIKVIY